MLYSERDYSQVKNIPDSCHSSQEWISPQAHFSGIPRKIQRRATSQTLQVSLSMLNINVHDSTIRSRLSKYDLFIFYLFERVTRRKPLLSMKNWGFQNCIWTNHKFSGTGSSEQMSCLAQMLSAVFDRQRERPHTVYQQKRLILSFKHSNAGRMIWGCVLSHDLDTLLSLSEPTILEANFDWNWNWVLQQDLQKWSKCMENVKQQD